MQYIQNINAIPPNVRLGKEHKTKSCSNVESDLLLFLSIVFVYICMYNNLFEGTG